MVLLYVVLAILIFAIWVSASIVGFPRFLLLANILLSIGLLLVGVVLTLSRRKLEFSTGDVIAIFGAFCLALVPFIGWLSVFARVGNFAAGPGGD
jgi:hypothetical protein